MKKAILAGLGLTVAIAPLVLVAQTSSKPAMYITKEEVDIVNKQPGTDRTIKVMDIGPENFSVGIIHRGPTGAAARGAAPAAAPGGGAARSTAAQQPACGEQAYATRSGIAEPGCFTISKPRATNRLGRRHYGDRRPHHQRPPLGAGRRGHDDAERTVVQRDRSADLTWS